SASPAPLTGSRRARLAWHHASGRRRLGRWSARGPRLLAGALRRAWRGLLSFSRAELLAQDTQDLQLWLVDLEEHINFGRLMVVAQFIFGCLPILAHHDKCGQENGLQAHQQREQPKWKGFGPHCYPRDEPDAMDGDE